MIPVITCGTGVGKIAPIGRIAEFNDKSSMECFEHFVAANGIAAAKKLSVFLTVIGPSTYEVLNNGGAGLARPEGLSRNQGALAGFVQPSKVDHRRTLQIQYEVSVRTGKRDGKRSARNCNFRVFLKQGLTDRLVVGLCNKRTPRALSAVEDVTFESACKLALDREVAEKQTAGLHTEAKTVHVDAVKVMKRARKVDTKPMKAVQTANISARKK